jgi:hypothetical protein
MGFLRSLSITTLNKEEAQVDHVNDANDAETCRKT